MTNNLQGGERVSRVAHNHEVGGSNPSPATNVSPHGVVHNGGGLTVRAGEPPLQSVSPVSAPDKQPGEAAALVAGRERAAVSPEAVARVLSQLEHAAEWLGSPYLEGVIERALAGAVQRANSPWLDRAGAAAYCQCSVSDIDRAAGKAFTKYFRGGTPLFRKDELDTAIADGRWPKRNQHHEQTTRRE